MSTDEHLLNAIERGDLGEVQKQLDERANPNVRDESGSTPLHHAAKGTVPEVVKLLLQSGADPTVVDNNLRNPLHYAVEKGQEGIARLLISAKSDTNPVS